MTQGKARVVDVGMTPFAKPGQSESYLDMARQATVAALDDADLVYGDVQQAFVGYVYADSAAGQAVLYGLGHTSIPIVNVNNNCSTGSSALWLARAAVESGSADCVLALGFEQMTPGALALAFTDRPSPLEQFESRTAELRTTESAAPFTAQFFGGAGQDYIDEYGLPPETFAQISVKARAHARHNPYAVFRQPVTVEEVLASPPIYGPLTRLQCCPPTCGAAAALICSEEFARRKGLNASVAIAAQAMATDSATTFTGDMRHLVGLDMTRQAAHQVYETAGVGPDEIPVVELHDCFTTNELLSYEALGLTPEGTAEQFIADGDNTYGGKVVTNPSGGLLSKGHPLGATGLAQCAELVWQLRDQAGPRQVDGARVALQHNLGLGGACVVTLYQKVA